MASFLYRLGLWCATHGRRVVAAWFVALALLGTLAATVSRPLSNEVTIPGSSFEEVLDGLQTEIPDSSGGIGTVVLHSDSGSFSQAQQAEIRTVFTEWEALADVRTVQDPFTNQQQLDDSRQQVTDGQQQLRDSRQQLDESWEELSRGQGQVDYGKAWIEIIEDSDPSNENLPQIRQQVRDGEQQLAVGYAAWAAGDGAATNGQRQLDEGRSLQSALGDAAFVSDDGYALTQVQFTTAAQSVDPEVKKAIPEIGSQLESVGVSAEYSVDITQENSLLGPGEIIGVAVAAIVLMLALGALIAAGMPLLNALVGVGVGLAAALATTHFFDMHAMTPALALMLGLAVGIDYSLFIVNRHRGGLLAGKTVKDSVGLAVGTSGSAVVVAGTTVVIALTALVVTGIPLLAQMGLVAAATVAIAVVVSLTLTPALLGLAGTRVISRRGWRKAGFETPGVAAEDADLDPDGDEHGGAWVRLVTRRAGLVVALVLVLCATIALPAMSLRLGLPDGSNEPADSTAHAAFVQAEEQFGAGTNGPIIAVATYPESVPSEDLVAQQAAVATQLDGVGGVASVLPFGVSEDRRTLAFQVVPTTGPAAAETVETVKLLHASEPAIQEATGASIGITGQTVANIEISQRLGAALPPYLAIVVGLSLLLLTIVFRSILVPLIATAGFLLSVAASFGATVAVYQWGWLGSIFAVDTPGPILSFMPIMLVGVLFGLAMDYQMFLVAGMKEAHSHGQPARQAVRTGFTHGAKVVFVAAIIMASVFAGFVFAHLTMIRPIGFALAVGVLVDALVVRMTLVPAVMHLLGERAWWMPRWLDRVAPHLDVEGSALARS